MKQQGEIMVDHRASPGLPEDVALAAGYDPKFCKEGKIYEQATLHCAHCLNITIKNPFRTRDRAYCAKCGGKYICDFCAFKASQPDYVHMPNAKWINEYLTDASCNQEGSPPKLILP